MGSNKKDETFLDNVREILNDKELTDIQKIHIILEWEPINNNAKASTLNMDELETHFMQPYIGKPDTITWYNSMNELEKNKNNRTKYYFININTGKENLIRNNYVFYFKMILYSFVYGLDLNTQGFKHDVVKGFIKIVKNVFINTSISRKVKENELVKSFEFLFYDIDKKNRIDFINPKKNYKWAFISPTYLKHKSNNKMTLNTENFNIESHFVEMMYKHNKYINNLH